MPLPNIGGPNASPYKTTISTKADLCSKGQAFLEYFHLAFSSFSPALSSGILFLGVCAIDLRANPEKPLPILIGYSNLERAEAWQLNCILDFPRILVADPAPVR